MAELPDEFDSKREMDAWLAENVRGEEVCHKTRDECGGCEKMVYKGLTEHVGSAGNETGSEVVPHYTTNREAVLDLLEVFCEEYTLDPAIRKELISIHPVPTEYWSVSVGFEDIYKIDPLAVSVTIYKAFKQIEETNRDS